VLYFVVLVFLLVSGGLVLSGCIMLSFIFPCGDTVVVMGYHSAVQVRVWGLDNLFSCFFFV